MLAPTFIKTDRIAACFDALKQKNQAALITFIMGGDPDYGTSLSHLKALVEAGSDIIEIEMAFTDPMADGPVIQASALRALQAGATVKKTLALVETFRQSNQETPIILMGYYNPIYRYGVDQFSADAAKAGVDGLIIVDLPPEEDAELRLPARKQGIDIIRLITPTTHNDRLPKVLDQASGWLYYIAIAGITGTRSAEEEPLIERIKYLKQHTELPLAVGFGIRTPDQARALAKTADGVIIGSAIVEKIAQGEDIRDFVSSLANAVHTARE